MSNRFLEEICEQPEALRRCAENFASVSSELEQLVSDVASGCFRQVILTGMGSSCYSCYPLWLTLNSAGIPTGLWEASELLHYAPESLSGDTLLIVVSQSGESIEIQKLTQLEHQAGASVSITNGLTNTAARWSQLALDTGAGAEATVSTKTYVTGLAVQYLLGARLLGKNSLTAVERILRTSELVAHFLTRGSAQLEAAVEFLRPHETLAFLGRGPSLASALTATLITQESSKLFCLGSSAAQFRHGPIELAREGFRAVIFSGGDTTFRLNLRLAQEIGECGGRSVVVLPEGFSLEEKELRGVFLLHIPAVEPELLPILEIVPVQLMTVAFAAARGFEPAVFERGHKVTMKE